MLKTIAVEDFQSATKSGNNVPIGAQGNDFEGENIYVWKNKNFGK